MATPTDACHDSVVVLVKIRSDGPRVAEAAAVYRQVYRLMVLGVNMTPGSLVVSCMLQDRVDEPLDITRGQPSWPSVVDFIPLREMRPSKQQIIAMLQFPTMYVQLPNHIWQHVLCLSTLRMQTWGVFIPEHRQLQMVDLR